MANGGIDSGGYPWPYGAYLDAFDLNSAFEGSAGTAAPARLAGFKRWVDTSAPPYAAQRYNDGTQPVLTGSFDTVKHLWLPQLGGGAASLTGSGVIDLGATPEVLINLTADQVTGFGASLPPGAAKLVMFASATLLVASTQLQIAGVAGNYTTRIGDFAVVVSLAAGDALVFFAGPPDAPQDGGLYARQDGGWVAAGPNLPTLWVNSGGSVTIAPGIARVFVGTTAAVTLTLPLNDCMVVDRSGDRTNPITVQPPAGGPTINGLLSFNLVNPWQPADFLYDGTNYAVIG